LPICAGKFGALLGNAHYKRERKYYGASCQILPVTREIAFLFSLTWWKRKYSTLNKIYWQQRKKKQSNPDRFGLRIQSMPNQLGLNEALSKAQIPAFCFVIKSNSLSFRKGGDE
jgi:hypothetical protein